MQATLRPVNQAGILPLAEAAQPAKFTEASPAAEEQGKALLEGFTGKYA